MFICECGEVFKDNDDEARAHMLEQHLDVIETAYEDMVNDEDNEMYEDFTEEELFEEAIEETTDDLLDEIVEDEV